MTEKFKTSGGKIYIPPDLVKQAESIGLLQYFKAARPDEIKRVGSDFCLKVHDSLRMSSNGKWNWFSHGIGGGNAISYLIKAENMSFQEAVLEVLDNAVVNYDSNAYSGNSNAFYDKADIYKHDSNAKREFVLPERDDDNWIIRRYLIEERGIDPDVVDHFIEVGTLYQERQHKSVCFIGCDKDGIPRIANLRGINTKFQSTTLGSDRSYGFEQKGIKDSVHIFEAPIDLMSYATLIKLQGYDFKHFNMLSLAGVYAPAKDIENSKRPVCLERYLMDQSDIKSIYVHFDNDEAGKNAARSIQYHYGSSYEVYIEHPPKEYKDINDLIRGNKTYKEGRGRQ